MYTLDANTIAPAMTAKKIEPKCCFKVSSTANVIFICLLSKKKCVYDKATLYMSMFSGIQDLVNKEKKGIEVKKMIEIEKEASGGSTKLDPFNFGLKTNYRQFPTDFSYISLSAETVIDRKSVV